MTTKYTPGLDKTPPRVLSCKKKEAICTLARNAVGAAKSTDSNDVSLVLVSAQHNGGAKIQKRQGRKGTGMKNDSAHYAAKNITQSVDGNGQSRGCTRHILGGKNGCGLDCLRACNSLKYGKKVEASAITAGRGFFLLDSILTTCAGSIMFFREKMEGETMRTILSFAVDPATSAKDNAALQKAGVA